MLDFAALKSQVSIEELIPFLDLQMKKTGNAFRGKCPACNSSNDRALVITPSKGAYYCFAEQKGGDCLSLVSHVKNIGVRQAAQEIADHFGLNEKQGAKSTPVPQEPESSKPTVSQAAKESDPTATTSLKPLTYLVYEHETVQALGLDPKAAENLGVGFAPKGLMRGRIVFPIYGYGVLLGYIGVQPGADVKLPGNLKEKTKAL